jgi:predicted dehydrogenase
LAQRPSIGELRALVVGLGSIGARHLANLRRLGCRDLGVLRVHGQLPPPPGADLVGVAVHTGLEAALARGYDLVFIANPTSLHLDVALPAARAGCHIYMEKPLSHSLAGTEDLAREVADRGLKLQMGCQLRFHPGLRAVKGWLEQGRIGRPLRALVEVGQYLPDWQPWRDYRTSYAARREMGGGVVLTLIHEIDYAQWLLGPLTPLAALGGRSGALEVDAEDHVTGLLGSRAGAAVVLSLDYLQRPPCRRLKILGTEGVIHWDYFSHQAGLVVEGREEARLDAPAGWRADDMYLDLTRDFLRAVTEGGPPAVPLEDGLAALGVALALREQLEGHRASRPLYPGQ